MKTPTASIIAALAIACAATAAHAAFIANSSGLASPVTTITFSEVPLDPETALTNQYAAYGVTFSNMYYNSQPIDIGQISQPLAENFWPITNPFSIFFTSVQTDAAFNFITNEGETTQFDAYLGGSLQASGSALTNISGLDYFGFSGVSFDEIRITVSGDYNGAAGVDNIQIGNVSSVPDSGSTVALMGLALATLGFVSRRSKKQAA